MSSSAPVSEDGLPEPPAKGARFLRREVRRTVLVAALGGFLFGYDTGVVSGALLFIPDDFETTSFTKGLIVSILLLGAMLGALLAGRAADRFGRKPALIGAAVVFTAGIAMCALAPTLGVLIAGRFVLGLGVGAASILVPLYVSEIAPPEQRGALVSLNQLMITIGIVCAYLVNWAFSASEDWRAMFAFGAIPSLLLLFGMLGRAESPRWLVNHGGEERLRRRFEKRMGREWTDAAIRQWTEEDDGLPERVRWRELLDPALRMAMVVGIGLAAIQQFTGINTVIYYAPTILTETGLDAGNAILNALPIGIVNVLVTIVAIRLVDRVGRRPLLLFSLAGMTVSLVVLGLSFTLADTLGGAQSWVALVSLVAYVASFAVGLGPVFWLLIAEIYPGRVRGSAGSAASSANWLSNFAVSLLFLPVIDAVGEDVTFWILAALCVASWFFVRRLVPETKGRTLEEISEDLGTTEALERERRGQAPGAAATA
jgi:sugar porter (SP) family MFS transporter